MNLVEELVKAGLGYLSTEEGAKLVTQVVTQQFVRYRYPKCLHISHYRFNFCPYCGSRLLSKGAESK